ncbi:uncharacterized protein EI97DRAFT_73383 [Westerdykella ornata]|uniref:Uncharacterized protein n=1 Tax=Westerdykella ornata TaxID=318751 RepID=A0A6A6JIB3_WESOR|nr:uncharacterized protein EI97DRAFT_73383 [Westerdykella ornata]KAF2275376.1 hypothetical protein EI97DRAFT_73383 [Westerdykella ornata]
MDNRTSSNESTHQDPMDLDGAQFGTTAATQTPSGATAPTRPPPSFPLPLPSHLPFPHPPLPFGPFPFPPLPVGAPATLGVPPMPFPFPPLPPFGLPPLPGALGPGALGPEGTPNHPPLAPQPTVTGSLLLEIALDDITPSSTGISHKTGFETICSYNWVRSPLSSPTIYVPGAPRKWTPPTTLPQSLRRSNLPHFVNENAFRAAEHQFEPVFQAMAIMKPDMRMNDVDVVSDRGSMQRLLDYTATRSVRRPYLIAAQRVRNTLFLRVFSEKSGIVGGHASGHGKVFEEKYTRDAMGLGELGSSFHRVVKYDFGGLTLVLRHEVDAYYEGPEVGTHPEQPPARDQYRGLEDVGIKSHKNAARVEIKGKDIPAAKMAEIKTAKKSGNVVQQMWLGRNPLAYPWNLRPPYGGRGQCHQRDEQSG